MTDLLNMQDSFNPSGYFMACWTRGFVQVYDAVPYVLLNWSFFRFATVAGIRLVLGFHNELMLDFPRGTASGHPNTTLHRIEKGLRYKGLSWGQC